MVQDEKFDTQQGPSIDQLVAKETTDKLTYMGWEVDQGTDPVKVGVAVYVSSSAHMYI